MKTQSKTLEFDKNVIVELTDIEIYNIQGASTYECSNCMSIQTF